MKLNKHQKEIIRKISLGNITDILSYIKAFSLGEYRRIDEEEIKERFHKKYDGRFFIITREKRAPINKEVWRNIEELDETHYKANIELADANGSTYHYKYRDSFADYKIYEKRYVVKDFGNIIGFIALWQYLHSKALIIELPRPLIQDDFSLCTDVIEPYHYEYGNRDKDGYGNNQKNKIEQLKNGAIIELWDTHRDYDEFIEWNFELNYEKLEICYGYLSKKIYPAPELTNFIQNKFMTSDEITQRNNYLIALAGIIIAIATSVLSLVSNLLGT